MPQVLHPLQPVIRRIAEAAYNVEARGAPCDLTLLEALAHDLRARTADKARQSTAPGIFADIPFESQGARCPLPSPSQPMAQVAPQTSYPCAAGRPAETLYALIGRADWRDRPYYKRLADAVVACAFGRSVDAVSRQYNIAHDVIGGGLVILDAEGPQGVMRYLSRDAEGHA